MFWKKIKDPLYRFKDFELEVRRATVKYGAKDETYVKKKSWCSSTFIWLTAFIPRIVDFNVRLWDFWRNRSYEGRLERMGIVGHSPIAFILPLGLLYFLFFGPSGGHWNGSSVKWILPLTLAIIAAVLIFRLVVGRKPISRRLRIFDVARLSLWSLLIAIAVVGFSRGPFAHAWFFVFVLLLWVTFAFGSHRDEGMQTTPPKHYHSLLWRFPWMSGIYLLAGLGSLYLYLSPMTTEKGTSLLWFWWYVIIIVVVFLTTTLLFMLSSKEKQRYGSWALWVQLGIIIAAGWVVWYFGGLREVDPDLYRHVLIPLTVVTLVLPLAIASVIARIIFRWRIKMIGSQFHCLLERVEIFGKPALPPLNVNKVLRSFLVTVRHVLMLLFIPALVVMLMPYFYRDFLKEISLTALAITFGILGYAKIHDRLSHFISLYQGMFFQGMQVVVSTLVIVLGITRLADIGYVSYIVEASPITLSAFILVAYLVLWFSEYWVNRVFGEEFLALLHPESKACGKVDFDYDNDDAQRETARTRVKAKGRRVQLHGNGQLVVVGEREWFDKNPIVEFITTEMPAKRENCVVIVPGKDGFNIGIFDAAGQRLKARDKQLADRINADPEAVARLKELNEKGEAGMMELLYFFESCGAIDLKNRKEKKLEQEKKQMDAEKGRLGTRFQFYTKFDLLDHLVENSILNDFDFGRKSAPSQVSGGDLVVSEGLTEVRNRLRWHVQDLRKQYASYYVMLTMILAIGIGFQVMVLTTIVDPPALSYLPPTAAVSGNIDNTASEQELFGLRSQLFDKTKEHSGNSTTGTGAANFKTPEPVILLAASGGGTRAALYTASVLHGLAKLGRLENVKLVSGVSGGGAALAYFYAHRHRLRDGIQPEPWADFYNAVSKDFIVRCLKGSAERRVAGGVRLGTLLDEGFQDHFFQGTAPVIGGKEIGILFNTAVAGEIHVLATSDTDVALFAQKFPKRAKSWGAGTRLVISNILEARLLKDIHKVSRDGLRYTTIVHPDALLSASAALNANFPPVFSNAAVDIDGRHRYWVTDGGAVDNRGVITLLYVLKAALAAQLDQQGKATTAKLQNCQLYRGGIKDERDAGHSIYPDIHIIVADASATTFDYTPKRGFGAISGTSRKLATGLIDELFEEVQTLYCWIHGLKADKIYLHNLSMPLTLRARGGLGTHWMMPLMATFKSCANEDPIKDRDNPKPISLSRNQILRAIAALHQPEGKENIGELVAQDPKLMHLLRKKNNHKEIVNWYGNDAAYLRGYGFRGEQVVETGVMSHPNAWEVITRAIGKQ